MKCKSHANVFQQITTDLLSFLKAYKVLYANIKGLEKLGLWYMNVKSKFLKASSGEHCVAHNFVLLLTLGGTTICLIVYLARNEKDK